MNGATARRRERHGTPWRTLLVLSIVAVAIRTVIASFADGVYYDIQSYGVVGRQLREHGFSVYAALSDPPGHRWPYPPGFMPWTYIVTAIADPGTRLFSMLIKAPMIAADVGLGSIAAWYLRGQGADERRQILGAAVVLFGPMMILISGHHGQLDSVAILPAALGFLIWKMWEHRHRAIVVGLLIGLAASMKTVPILLAIPLFASARSWRERIELSAAVVIVPAALFAPFVLSTPEAVVDALTYAGLPGFGGLSLVLQPSLAGWWMKLGIDPALSGLGVAAWEARGPIVVGIALAAAAVCLAKRPDPVHAAVMMWLAVYTLAPNFAFQYLVWGIPFLVMAGYLRETAAAQAFLLIPAVITYTPRFYGHATLDVYVVCMVIAWLAGAVALIAQTRTVLRQRWGTT